MPADPVVIREGADVALGRERDALVVEEGGSNTAASTHKRQQSSQRPQFIHTNDRHGGQAPLAALPPTIGVEGHTGWWARRRRRCGQKSRPERACARS